MEDIYRYVVRRSDPNPMYGHDKKLSRYYETKEEAIAKAEEFTGDDIYVEERQYTSERNLERDFTLYARPVWARWF